MKPTPPPTRAAPGRHVYDVIVMGGQLGGALTAALLARRGIKVLLVPHDGLGSPYIHQGFLLPLAPFVMPPVKAVDAFEEALAELGLTVPVHRALGRPALQLLTPGNWFELRSEPKERAVELKRALGARGADFEASWQGAVAAADASNAFFKAKIDIPPEGVLGRWRLNRQLPRFTGMEVGTPLPEGSTLRSLLPFAAPVAQPGPLTTARALGRLLAWPSVYPGGREGLYQLFAERARELGADVMGPSDVVEQLAFRGSSASSVRLGGSLVSYRAEQFVVAMDLEALAPLVPESRQATIKRLSAQVPVKKRLFTVNTVLPEAALPPGLGTLALIDVGPGVLLQVTPARGPAVDAEKTGLKVLTATMETSQPLKPGDEAAIRAQTERVWKILEEVLPFSRRRARLESTPWLHAPAIIDGRGEPSALFELPADSWFGVTGIHPQSPLRRLLFASRQVLPGLGLEGEVLAAMRVTDRIDRVLKRNDPLRARKTA